LKYPQDTRPLVFSHREKNTQRLAALDEQAEGLGLKRGMGLADARARYPDIEVLETDPQADSRSLAGLADWCDRYTPLVAFDRPDGLFLDITGCAHLFGGERKLLDDLVSRFCRQGFDIRAGLASTPGVAWAAARFAGSSVVEPGKEGEALAPLPLSALRLEPAVCAGLESMGLRTAGAVMAVPRAPLVRRFGKSLLVRLDQALGVLEEAISPRMSVAPLSVERRLTEPISLVDDIERLTGLLAETLRDNLERRGQGAREMELALFRVDGAVSRIACRTSRPLREPHLVCRLFRERLGALESAVDAGYGFDLVRLSVTSSAALEIRQTDLSGEDDAGIEDDLALVIDRIGARLGTGAVVRSVAAESHIPERATSLLPFGEAVSPAVKSHPFKHGAAASRPGPPERPIRLLRPPEPVEATAAEVPEGPPASFRWRRAMHRVARAEGPERIAPEWWHEGADVTTRDYFRVEDDQGRRYWLYRQGFYDAAEEPPRWFMHGLFA
jgi:protein ImuB